MKKLFLLLLLPCVAYGAKEITYPLSAFTALTDPAPSGKYLGDEIDALGLAQNLLATQVGADVKLIFDADIDAVTASIDGVVASHTGFNLADYKAQKRQAILNKTVELEEALTFTFETKVFKLNNAYQDKWMNIYTLSGDGLITYPKNVSDVNGLNHALDDHTDVTNFVGTGLATAEAFYAGDDAYYVSIDSATTKAEIDAVVDTR